MSKLYFIRHAQASYGAKNYDKLSERGIKQSEILGNYLSEKNIKFDKVFCGPLQRQLHTCNIVSLQFNKKNMDFPAATILSGLKEHEGTEAFKKNIPELIKTVPFIKELFDAIDLNPKLAKRNSLLAFQYFMNEWAEGNIKIPDVESWGKFRKNTKDALEIILENTGKGETVGIFSSGGTISSITADSLNMNDEKRVAAMNFSARNTSFSTFLYSDNNFNLLSFNEIPHLNEKIVTFV